MENKLAIQEVLNKMMRAWNAQDANAYALLFTENASHTNVLGQKNKGRAVIEKQHALILSTIFKNTQLEIMEAETEFITPGIATSDVIWTMTGATLPDGSPWPERRGLLNLLFTQKDSEWKIHIFHNMELKPMPTPLNGLLQNNN